MDFILSMLYEMYLLTVDIILRNKSTNEVYVSIINYCSIANYVCRQTFPRTTHEF